MSNSGKMPDLTALLARQVRCAQCARRFRARDILLIDSAPRVSVFRLHCAMCLSRRLVIGVWNKNTLRLCLTELDEQEWRHYRHARPIQSDDVLRVVEMLRSYEGDFSDVLEDPLFDESA